MKTCHRMKESSLLINPPEEVGSSAGPTCFVAVVVVAVVSRIPQNRMEGLWASIQGQRNHAWLSECPKPRTLLRLCLRSCVLLWPFHASLPPPHWLPPLVQILPFLGTWPGLDELPWVPPPPGHGVGRPLCHFATSYIQLGGGLSVVGECWLFP